MLYSPRPYQEDTLQSLRHNYDRGLFRQLVVSATGTGKTTMAMHLPRRFPDLFDKHGMAFMVHRREIIFQTAEKFRQAYPHLSIGIEMGENHAIGTEDIIFFSVDSIGRVVSSRIEKYRKRFFGVFVTDEAHHALPESTYDNVLSYFGLGSEDDSHFILPDGQRPVSILLTATPDRADDNSILPLLDTVAFRYDADAAVRDGWLVDINARQAISTVPIMTDAEEINFLMRIVETNGPGHKTLLFARNVEQSQNLAESINRNSPLLAGHVDATTPSEEREILVNSFQEGDLDLLTNRLVYTEGWDSPIITQIIDNARTESRPLFGQKIGRGMRPHPLARVDDYNTAWERRQAIAASPKEHLTYIATFEPTKHSMTPARVIFGVPVALKERPVNLTEVVDIIKNLEDEQPERPYTDIIREINESDIIYREANVWNQTIYNDEWKVVTSLRWIKTDDGAAIYFPLNPRPARDYDKVPTIYHFRKDDQGWYEFVEIQLGGWLPHLKRPRRRTVETKGRVRRLEDGIRQVDRWLKANKPDTYSMMLRSATNRPVSDVQRRYIERHGICSLEGLTGVTADYVIENHRINKALNE